MEFIHFEDNFNHCILPLFEELGQVNASIKAELEAHAQQFWSSFEELYLGFEKRMSLVKQFFKNIANNLQQNYDLIAFIVDYKNRLLKLTSVKSIKPEDGNSMTEWHDSTTANILYIYNVNANRNGFFILDKFQQQMQLSRLSKLKSFLFTDPFSKWKKKLE